MPWFWQKKPDDPPPPPPSELRASPPPSSSFSDPKTLASTAILTATLLGLSAFYRARLRRIPNLAHLPPSALHSTLHGHPRPLFGRVLSVGDGDGLRFYHTPGGRLALWGVLRRVPGAPFPRAAHGASFLAAQTLSVRLSGVDAPEGAHFGKPAQPFAAAALEYLRRALLGRAVRLYPHSRDQYGRVVGTVLARPWAGWALGWPVGWQRDVGLEMVQRGLATVYEARTGTEYGGPERRRALQDAEARARSRRVGMWSLATGSGGRGAGAGARPGLLQRILAALTGRREAERPKLETPREYKTRTAKEEQQSQNGGR